MISERLKRLKEHNENQQNLHVYAVEREKLQIQALQQQLKHQTEIQILRLEKEREVLLP